MNVSEKTLSSEANIKVPYKKDEVFNIFRKASAEDKIKILNYANELLQKQK